MVEDCGGGFDVGDVVVVACLVFGLGGWGEDAVEEVTVGELVGVDALELHVRDDGGDGALLRFWGQGAEGGGRVGDEAVEDDGEGDDVRGAVCLGHLLEVGLDGGLGFVADDGAEEDVEGAVREGHLVVVGPGEDAGDQGAPVRGDESGYCGADGAFAGSEDAFVPGALGGLWGVVRRVDG